MNAPRYTVLVRSRMMSQWAELEQVDDLDRAKALALGYWNAGNYSAGVRDNHTDELIYAR